MSGHASPEIGRQPGRQQSGSFVDVPYYTGRSINMQMRGCNGADIFRPPCTYTYPSSILALISRAGCSAPGQRKGAGVPEGTRLH